MKERYNIKDTTINDVNINLINSYKLIQDEKYIKKYITGLEGLLNEYYSKKMIEDA